MDFIILLNLDRGDFHSISPSFDLVSILSSSLVWIQIERSRRFTLDFFLLVQFDSIWLCYAFIVLPSHVYVLFGSFIVRLPSFCLVPSSVIMASKSTDSAINQTQRLGSTKSDAFQLSNNGHLGVFIATTSFLGNNYLTWSTSIQISLGAKDKLGFIDSPVKKPNESCSYYLK